jgi:hypothetical protein
VALAGDACITEKRNTRHGMNDSLIQSSSEQIIEPGRAPGWIVRSDVLLFGAA